MPNLANVTVKVTEARNLTGIKKGVSDPYVELVFKPLKSKKKTKVKKKTVAPSWKESFEFKGLDLDDASAVLMVEVWHSTMGLDDCIGTCQVPLSDAVANTDQWVKLAPRPGKKDKVSGEIHLGFKVGANTGTPAKRKGSGISFIAGIASAAVTNVADTVTSDDLSGKIASNLKSLQETAKTGGIGEAIASVAEAVQQEVVDVINTVEAEEKRADDLATQLLKAVRNNNVQEVRASLTLIDQYLVDQPVITRDELVNAVDAAKWAPIHYAASEGMLEIVEVLLEHEGSVTLKNNVGNNLIHLLCKLTGEEERRKLGHLLKLLTDKEFNINSSNNNLETPLHLACTAGNTPVVRWLLPLGADVASFNKHQEIPLHCAIKAGNREIVENLINFGSRIPTTGKQDALALARSRGFKEIEQYLKVQSDGGELSSGGPTSLSAMRAKIDFGSTKQQKLMVLAELLSQSSSCTDVERDGIVNMEFGDHLRPIHLAAEEGNIEILELLLLNKANVNVRDKNDWTPLHYAVHGGFLDVAEVLVERGADITCPDDSGTVAFHYLCGIRVGLPQWEMFQHVAELFLQKGQDINCRNSFRESPLFEACLNRRGAIVKWLLSKGADINLQNQRHDTAMHFAARSGDRGIVALLKAANADLTMKGTSGTPRDAAFHFNQPHIVSLFDAGDETMRTKDFEEYVHSGNVKGIVCILQESKVRHGVDTAKMVNSPMTSDGKLPIVYAAQKGMVDVISALIKLEANVNVADEATQDTALLSAVRGAFYDLMPLLLEAGADVKAQNKQKNCVLHYLAMMGEAAGDNKPLLMETLEKVVAKGLPVDLANAQNETALHRACTKNDLDVVNFLLDKGANVNAPARQKMTPLHYAARAGKLELIDQLCSRGASYKSMSDLGNPEELARSVGLSDAAERLAEEVASKLKQSIIDTLKANDQDNLLRLLKKVERVGVSLGELAKEDILAQKRALHLLSMGGSLDAAKQFLAAGASVADKDENGHTPIDVAAKYGHIELTKVYLEQPGASLGDTNGRNTAMHYIAGSCIEDQEDVDAQTAVLEKLVSMGQDVNCTNEQGETPLHRACRACQLTSVEWLVAHNADVNVKCKVNNETALHIAARTGNRALVEMLILKGARLSEKTADGQLAKDIARSLDFQHVVASFEEEEPGVVVEKIEQFYLKSTLMDLRELTRLTDKALRQGRDAKQLANMPLQDGQKPLHLCSITGDFDVVEFLLKNGADPAAPDGEGFTPLIRACQYSNFAAVEMLLEASAPIDAVDKDNLCAFHYLVTAEPMPNDEADETLYRYVLDLFIEKGQDINAQDSDNETPLHKAIKAEKKEIVTYLLMKDCDLNSQTICYDEQPIHYAARTGSVELVELLIVSGASVLTEGAMGTALMIATAEGHEELVKALTEEEAEQKAGEGKALTGKRPSEQLAALGGAPSLSKASGAKNQISAGQLKRWEVRLSPSGKQHYVDHKTQKIHWTLPEGSDLQELLVGDSAAKQPTWERKLHHTGNIYYVNTKTGDIEWDLPEGVEDDDVCCFDQQIIEDEEPLPPPDPNDHLDPGTCYAKIKEDPRFKRLLVKYCPTWFSLAGIKQNLMNFADPRMVPVLGLVVKTYRAGDRIVDARRMNMVANSAEANGLSDKADMKTMVKGLNMEAARLTVTAAMSIGFKALFMVCPIQCMIPGFSTISEVAAEAAGTALEVGMDAVTDVALGLGEAATDVAADASLDFVGDYFGDIGMELGSAVTEKGMVMGGKIGSKMAVKKTSLAVAQAALVGELAAETTNQISSQVFMKYGHTRALMKYLGYPEDKSDVYAAFEQERLYLKTIYGAKAEDNLFLMKPTPKQEAILVKQEMTGSQYNLAELGDLPYLMLLWRAYACWDAVNYLDKASRFGSKIKSLVTGTHYTDRQADSNRKADAKKMFAHVTNKNMICISKKHVPLVTDVLQSVWGAHTSKFADRVFNGPPKEKQLRWFAEYGALHFINKGFRIWAYKADDEVDEWGDKVKVKEGKENILASVFFEPRDMHPASFYKALAEDTGVFDYITCGQSAINTLVKNLRVLEKVRVARAGLKVNFIHMVAAVPGPEGEKALKAIITTLLDTYEGDCWTYAFLKEKPFGPDYYQKNFGFQIIGNDPIGDGQVAYMQLKRT